MALLYAWLPIWVVGAGVFVALTIKQPRYALYALGFSLGVNLTLVAEPVHISLPQIFALAVIAGVALRIILVMRPTIRSSSLWPWCGILFTVATLPAIFNAISPTRALIGTLQLFLISLLIYATVILFQSQRVSGYRVCQFIILGAVVSAIHAFIQTGFALGPETFFRGGLLRAYASYGQPNSYGHYLAGVAPLSFALIMRRRRYAIPFLIICFALLLTGSRAAILSTILTVAAVLALLQFKRRTTAILLILISTTAVGIGVLISPASWLGSLVTISDWSARQRLLALLTAWRGISRRPLTGYGPGSFQTMLGDLSVEGLTDDIEMPHNMLLDIWFELGLLALVMFLALVGLYYVTGVRTYIRTADVPLLALLGSFTGLLIASMFGTLVVRGIGEFLALVVGLTAGRVATLAKDRRAISTSKQPRSIPEDSPVT